MQAPSDTVILVVEDNPDDEELTLRAFRRHRISNRVVIAHDGVEAIDYLLGDSPTAGEAIKLPHLVLLDLKLPRLDGLEVLRRMRADPRTRMTPVVVLTSSNEERDLAAAYSNGANSYIRKPVNYESFVEVVGRLGMYWMLTNEPPPLIAD